MTGESTTEMALLHICPRHGGGGSCGERGASPSRGTRVERLSAVELRFFAIT